MDARTPRVLQAHDWPLTAGLKDEQLRLALNYLHDLAAEAPGRPTASASPAPGVTSNPPAAQGGAPASPTAAGQTP